MCASTAALLLPAVSHGASGGSGLSGSSGTSSQPQTQPGETTVSASANGITVTTEASAFLRNALRFSGSVPQSDVGDAIEIQRSGHETGWAWTNTAQAQVGSDGSFAVVWHTNHIGRFAVRAVVLPSGSAASSQGAAPDGGGASASPRTASASSGWPTITVTVYRSAIATLFGPGFYGQRTACGQILRRNTIGVANRTLPCGTPVSIYYRGRTMVVPVIDRGPYANGADWDLTMATGRALGIDETVTLGAVSLPQQAG